MLIVMVVGLKSRLESWEFWNEYHPFFIGFKPKLVHISSIVSLEFSFEVAEMGVNYDFIVLVGSREEEEWKTFL
jgi:hypothetical protein